LKGKEMLNTNSPLPLYRQIADIISEKMHTGEYSPGNRIPSEHDMAKLYGVGRPTVRQATDVLIRKGLLRRKRGAGTFVRNRHREVDLFSLAGTLSSFKKKGISITSEIVSPIRQMRVDGNTENPFFDTDAYFFSRISRVEDEPVLMENIYLHAGLFRGIERFDLAGRSLSRIISDYFYLTPTGGRQNFRIDYPDSARATMLDVPGETPILAVSRFIDFPNIKNGVYSDLFCRTDRFVFSQTLGGLQDEK
jgi:GntR family transcriptional regulator